MLVLRDWKGRFRSDKKCSRLLAGVRTLFLEATPEVVHDKESKDEGDHEKYNSKDS